jgi:hypothetical protein
VVWVTGLNPLPNDGFSCVIGIRHRIQIAFEHDRPLLSESTPQFLTRCMRERHCQIKNRYPGIHCRAHAASHLIPPARVSCTLLKAIVTQLQPIFKVLGLNVVSSLP